MKEFLVEHSYVSPCRYHYLDSVRQNEVYLIYKGERTLLYWNGGIAQIKAADRDVNVWIRKVQAYTGLLLA